MVCEHMINKNIGNKKRVFAIVIFMMILFSGMYGYTQVRDNTHIIVNTTGELFGGESYKLIFFNFTTKVDSRVLFNWNMYNITYGRPTLQIRVGEEFEGQGVLLYDGLTTNYNGSYQFISDKDGMFYFVVALTSFSYRILGIPYASYKYDVKVIHIEPMW